MKINYTEGDVFAVPLRADGYALGVVARVSSTPGLVLGYFFPRKYLSLPSISNIQLEPMQAEKKLIFGDLALVKKEWLVLGQLKTWNRSYWPIPDFFRKDEVFRKAWRVQYSDHDISRRISEERVPFSPNLEGDSVYGAGAIEILLTRLTEHLPASHIH